MKTVYFRTFEENDYDLIYQWRNDENLNRLSVGLNRKVSRDECREWVKARINPLPYELWWGICSKEDDSLIGYTYLTKIHYINRSAEFGGIVIGDRNYQDGFAWIETYLFVLEYCFDRLNLNRVYGYYISEHTHTKVMSEATYFKIEGVHAEALFKNGKYHDQIDIALLSRDYHMHLSDGHYTESSIIRRLIEIKRDIKADS